MKLGTRFLQKFASSIIAVLSCFDRVIFKGHLPFGGDGHLNAFVDKVLQMRRKDFISFAQEQSEKLVRHAKQSAEREARPYMYLRGRCRKEKLIQEIIRQDGLTEGLIAVLCCQETCRTVKLKHARQRPELTFAYRPQRVLYYYRLDPEFGLIYVRLQTWFPYIIQIYVNGHDWLARQMAHKKLGFIQRDNAFTQLDDPQQAQRIADRFAHLAWISRLDRWANQVNPVRYQSPLRNCRYYWVIEQAEYATDVLFGNRGSMSALYRRLLDHATVNFSAPDILTFLGRKLHGNFNGEVVTDCKHDRWPGARIKHRVKENWLKMYDKFGQMLRIETVINQPREFRVRRKRTRKGRQQMVWCPMNKGVVNFYQYRNVAHAANGRYLDGLSVVDDVAPSYRQVEQLAQAKVSHNRSYAGFNPARGEDVRWLRAVLDGKYQLKGFQNADIRVAIHGDTNDMRLRVRQRASIGRIFKRLHVRGLLAKIPHTRRWRVTRRGNQVLGKVVQLYYHGLATAA